MERNQPIDFLGADPTLIDGKLVTAEDVKVGHFIPAVFPHSLEFPLQLLLQPVSHTTSTAADHLSRLFEICPSIGGDILRGKKKQVTLSATVAKAAN